MDYQASLDHGESSAYQGMLESQVLLAHSAPEAPLGHKENQVTGVTQGQQGPLDLPAKPGQEDRLDPRDSQGSRVLKGHRDSEASLDLGDNLGHLVSKVFPGQTGSQVR